MLMFIFTPLYLFCRSKKITISYFVSNGHLSSENLDSLEIFVFKIYSCFMKHDLCFLHIILMLFLNILNWWLPECYSCTKVEWQNSTKSKSFEKYCPNKVFILTIYPRMPVSCCAVTACIEKSAASLPGLHSSFGLSFKTGARWPPSSGKW